MIRRAKVYLDLQSKEKQAVSDESQRQLMALKQHYEQEKAAAERELQRRVTAVAQLFSQVNLLEIASNGLTIVLNKLNDLGALVAISDINKVYAFQPPGSSIRVSSLDAASSLNAD